MPEKDVEIGFGADYSDDEPILIKVSEDVHELMCEPGFYQHIYQDMWEEFGTDSVCVGYDPGDSDDE